MTNPQTTFNSGSSGFIVTSGTASTVSGNFINFSTTGSGTFYGMHGLTISNKDYGQEAIDGNPMFEITTEDDTIICLKVCYCDDETCQDIPEDFDIDFESLINLAVHLNKATFESLYVRIAAIDPLTQIVYKLNGQEACLTLKDLSSLVRS